MLIFNMFVSCAESVCLQSQSVCPQHRMSSSLVHVINMFVCSVVCIRRSVADTILWLAMNAFIYSMKAYLEVGSRDYLVTSDRRVCLLFGSWFRSPTKKEQKLHVGENSFWKNFVSSYGWTYIKDRNKVGMKKFKNTTLQRNVGALLFGFQCNLMHLNP